MFAQALAEQIDRLSGGTVDCVVYTRHPRVAELDSDRLIINFTLDYSSESRRDWAPPESRLVYSAFEGVLSPNVAVNFLEHHRWSHIEPTAGDGHICPATLPTTPVRTCDAVRCDLCFKKPDGLIKLGAS